MSEALNHPPAKIVRQLLVNLGIVSMPPEVAADPVGNWPCYVNLMPNKPDEVVAIYNTEGYLQGRIMFTGRTVSKPGIVLNIRSRYPAEAWTKARRILHAFDYEVRRNTVVMDGTVYRVQAIHRTGEAIELGPEVGSTTRSLYSANAVTSIYTVSSEADTGTGS